jgi:hypothetical protein
VAPRYGEDPYYGADDHPGQSAGHQAARQRTVQQALAVVAQQGAGAGHHVEQQIGGRDRRAGHPEDAQLHGQQEHGTRNAHRRGHHRYEQADGRPGRPC